MMKQIAEASPRLKARVAGVFWLMVFMAGSLALFIRGGPLFSAANIVAPLCYIVVTLLLYDLLKPVNRCVSLLAAFFGLAGCAISLFGLTGFILLRDLVFFGLQCLLVGYLIFRSTFLPRILGVLMVFAGLGWLTFLWPPLAKDLSPYNLAPGMIGEGLLIVWLLVAGVNERRWKEQAGLAGRRG
ncbi:MAG: DUF4386 domain-containing protein [Acidobacteria bacterium]|nr:DUF4386 domain-containing protein [Acidobacteriota bacterium]